VTVAETVTETVSEGASKIPRLALYGALFILAAVIAIGVWRNYTPAAPASSDVALKSSASAGGADAANAIAALEARTAKDKTDVEGWQLLGWSYFEAGRYTNAAAAYRTAATLAPDKAVYWSSLGEALTMASAQDPMPNEAAAAFEKAIKLDPKDPRARYFMAVRRDLAGDHQGAIGDWLALLKDTPKDAPWETDLVRTIEQVGQINKIDVATQIAAVSKNRTALVSRPSAAMGSIAAAPIPGPTGADMAAAAKLPPGQQQAMVETMVNGLEAKLAKNPANVDGWIMLMRSRMTLGETVKASAALKQAIAANPTAREKLMREAEVLGVT
jgi:cytochrome c-type biogenesis protein CcmH